MPQKKFLNDQTSFDCLAKTDIIGNEQIDARHVDRTYQRIELEVLDTDAAAKRSLEKPPIGVRCCPPSHSIKKGVERTRIVLSRDQGKARALDDLSARLDFPNDFQLFTKPILVDRGKRYAVLRC